MSEKRKLVVVGDGACGKTCLLTTYTSNEFPETHVPTIYDITTKDIVTEDFSICMVFYDTAGEEDYDRLRPLAYPQTNVVLICYSVDKPSSLYNVKHKWAKEIKHFLPDIPVILVATKLDLRNNPGVIKTLQKLDQHPVTYKEGEKVAKQIKADKYMECSAKTLLGVKTIFEEAALLSLVPKNTSFFRNCTVL